MHSPGNADATAHQRGSLQAPDTRAAVAGHPAASAAEAETRLAAGSRQKWPAARCTAAEEDRLAAAAAADGTEAVAQRMLDVAREDRLAAPGPDYKVAAPLPGTPVLQVRLAVAEGTEIQLERQVDQGSCTGRQHRDIDISRDPRIKSIVRRERTHKL